MNQEITILDNFIKVNNIQCISPDHLHAYLFNINKKRYNYFHQLLRLSGKYHDFTPYVQDYISRHDINTMADALIVLLSEENITNINYTLINTLVSYTLPLHYRNNNYRNGLMLFCEKFTCSLPRNINNHNGVLEYMCYNIKNNILDQDISNNNVVNILCKKICISKLFSTSNADMLNRVLSAALRTISSDDFISLINNIDDAGCTPVHNCLDSLNLECFEVLCKYEQMFNNTSRNFIQSNNDMLYIYDKIVESNSYASDLASVENSVNNLALST